MAIEIDKSPEMMRQYWVIEHHGNIANRILHVTTKPRNEKGAYVELKSLNGFRRRCTQRLSNHYDKDIKAHHARLAVDPDARMVYTSPAVWYDVRDSYQWQIDRHVFGVPSADGGTIPAPYDGAPVIEAGGVFDLYALIGYDHRRDRYSAPAPGLPTV